MKKLYLILGNKPFEDKLSEQLSKAYRFVGSANSATMEVAQDVLVHDADTIIVRESLADNQDDFLEFLKHIKNYKPHLKIVTILHSHEIGSSFLFSLVQLGIYDIINGGTRLQDVIEMSTRESTVEDVRPLLLQNQFLEVQSAPQLTAQSVEEDVEDDIDIVIELSGELQAEEVVHHGGFKERYMTGITQVYSGVDQDEALHDEPTIAPKENIASSSVLIDKYNNHQIDNNDLSHSLQDIDSLEDNNEIEPEEENDKDTQAADIEMVSFDESSDCDEQVEEDEIDETKEFKPLPTKYIMHAVRHTLKSSIGMQLAVELSKSGSVLYIETDIKNRQLVAPCESKGVSVLFIEKYEGLNEMLSNVHGRYNYVVINTKHLTSNDFLVDVLFVEWLQDKDDIKTVSELRFAASKTITVFSYFEPDLPSVKNLCKSLGCKGIKWANTRTEEYNSRLNTKILHNEAVIELVKEV